MDLGADVFIDGSTQNVIEEMTKMGGADAILCTAHSSEAVLGMLPALAYEGKLLALSLPLESAPLSLRESVRSKLCALS